MLMPSNVSSRAGGGKAINNAFSPPAWGIVFLKSLVRFSIPEQECVAESTTLPKSGWHDPSSKDPQTDQSEAGKLETSKPSIKKSGRDCGADET
jgi:hypothetical protein